LLIDAKISQNITKVNAPSDIQFAGESSSGSYAPTNVFVDGKPGQGGPVRILKIKPIKPWPSSSGTQITTEQVLEK
jgi:hypothetical protein